MISARKHYGSPERIEVSVTTQADDIKDRVAQLRERWDNKLRFPFSELGKHYVRGDATIVLKCALRDPALISAKLFTLTISFENSTNAGGEGAGIHSACRQDDSDFPMLITTIHIVNDTDEVIARVWSRVRLRLPDQIPYTLLRDALYFSFKSLDFVCGLGFCASDRKLNSIFIGEPVGVRRKMPDDVVETGSQMVRDLATNDAKCLGDSERRVIRTSVQELLRIYIGHSRVFAFFKENANAHIEIVDCLLGPL